TGQKDDPLLQKARENVIGALTSVCLLDNHRDKIERSLDRICHGETFSLITARSAEGSGRFVRNSRYRMLAPCCARPRTVGYIDIATPSAIKFSTCHFSPPLVASLTRQQRRGGRTAAASKSSQIQGGGEAPSPRSRSRHPRSDGRQRLLEVGNDVFHILDTDRQADHVSAGTR